MFGCDDRDFGSADETAKTLRLRDVCFEPHSGHFTSWAADIDFTNCSKWFLQDLQVYS
jgi:hypothetical protein